MSLCIHTQIQRHCHHPFVHWTDDETNSRTADCREKENIQPKVCQCRPDAVEKLGGTCLAQSLVQQSFEMQIFPISQAGKDGENTIICIDQDQCMVKKRHTSLHYWPPILRLHWQPPATAGKHYWIIG